MEIRENRVHPDHTEHAGTENNAKNILPQRVFIVVLQNGNLLIALIYSWDTSVWNGCVFFFVIVCQIFHYLYQILFITEAHLTVLLSEIKNQIVVQHAQHFVNAACCA